MASLLEGFGSHPINPSSGRSSGTTISTAHVILQTALFEPWDIFDAKVTRTVSYVRTILTRQGCRENSQDSSHCNGSFRNVDCAEPTCNNITRYKVRSSNLEDEPLKDLQDHVHAYLLTGMGFLAKKIKPEWRGVPYVNPTIVIPYKDSSKRFRPAACVLQPGQQVPDVTLCMRFPNRANLLLSQGSHRTLASAYRAACSNIGDTDWLRHELNGIAQTIAYALCTRTGMACLYNHNEAVFVRATTRILHRGAGSSSRSSEASGSSNASRASSRSREELHVQISRKYRCNGHPSTFHALLTMMLLAFENSSDSAEGRNTRHLEGLIDISEQRRGRS